MARASWRHCLTGVSTVRSEVEELLEYKEREPDGLQYSRFCERYRQWRGRIDVVLRQEHRGGGNVFVNFARHKVPVISRDTDEVREAQIFVWVLGASNFTYAEACESQEPSEWISAQSGTGRSTRSGGALGKSSASRSPSVSSGGERAGEPRGLDPLAV